MKMSPKGCGSGLFAVWIVAALIGGGHSAPSSRKHESTHRAKRSADLMSMVSNMLLQHSPGAPVYWPDFLDFFNYDYAMDDGWDGVDDKNSFLADDRYVVDYDGRALRDNGVSLGGIDYDCPVEEKTEIVPIVEVKNRSPDDESFVFLEPGKGDSYDGDDDFEESVERGEIPPPGDELEVEEAISKNPRKTPQDDDEAWRNVQNLLFGKEAKFTIHDCFSKPAARAPAPDSPFNERKGFGDSGEDEYVVLLIRKDHLVGGRRGENRTETSTTKEVPEPATTTVSVEVSSESTTTSAPTATESTTDVGQTTPCPDDAKDEGQTATTGSTGITESPRATGSTEIAEITSTSEPAAATETTESHTGGVDDETSTPSSEYGVTFERRTTEGATEESITLTTLPGQN